MNAGPLRVVLVDDHALCRNGLTDLLHHRGNITVVAALGDPEQVAGILREHKPDLLVLDLRMPSTDGLTLLRRLRAEGCDTPALILTMSDAEADLAAALRAGVRGYLLKDMEPEEVIAAIERAARGELTVAPAMTLKLAQMLQLGSKGSERKDLLGSLTERERQILDHLARGSFCCARRSRTLAFASARACAGHSRACSGSLDEADPQVFTLHGQSSHRHWREFGSAP